MAVRQPNILILMVDQLTPGVLATYGGKVARTPHIDRLAERAVVFDSAYCNSPLCAPSRFSFMSGQLPSAIGAYDNAADFPADTPTFAHYLRHAGYRTMLSGKMHFCGPDQLHGFEERLTTDIYPADFGWTADWTRPGERLEFYHTMDSVSQAGPCVRSNQIDFDEEVVFAARRKLFDMARDCDERPFCMVVSMTHPHDPYTIPEPWWSRQSDEEIDLPRVSADEVVLDPHSRRLRTVIGLEQQSVTEAQVRAARRAYYGACAYVDDQIGSMLAALDECRMAEDTVVMLLGDHGDMLGERGLWYKMNFFEPACRIPLMIAAPGRFAPSRVAASVSLLDILPTLVEIAGDGAAVAYAAPVHGQSLLPHLTGQGGHDQVIGEYLGEGAISPIVMLRRGALKFIHCPVDPDQLYDLSADPDERTNLAADPAHAGAVAAFRAEVAQRWSLERVNQEVLASQARRRLVDAALKLGKQTHWDHQPVVEASQSYMRNHIKLDDLEAMARFPRVG
ncbi:MAG TPA: choline-sulfatase [Caulobacteraceae bacterium]|jgi:choline-sulfatase